MNRMLLIGITLTITVMMVVIPVMAITRCLPAADDPRVLGGISVAIMVGVLVIFLYIIHIFDLNPEYRYSNSIYSL
jgi:hypothetical protein